MKLTEQFKKKLNNTKWRELNRIFVDSCSQGNFKIVEYLSTHPQLKYAIEINQVDGSLDPLTAAAWSGHLNIVQFLLTSNDILEKAEFTTRDIYSEGHHALRQACNHNRASIVKFLLENCYSKSKRKYKNILEKYCKNVIDKGTSYDVIDVFMDNSKITGLSSYNILIYSAMFDHDVSEHLIYKYDLVMDKKLTKFLESIKNSHENYDQKVYKKLNELFSSKMLHATLNKNLTEKTNTRKTLKVKL